MIWNTAAAPQNPPNHGENDRKDKAVLGPKTDLPAPLSPVSLVGTVVTARNPQCAKKHAYRQGHEQCASSRGSQRAIYANDSEKEPDRRNGGKHDQR